eukprot:8990346-Pyramimonas_sp.AAC.1
MLFTESELLLDRRNLSLLVENLRRGRARLPPFYVVQPWNVGPRRSVDPLLLLPPLSSRILLLVTVPSSLLQFGGSSAFDRIDSPSSSLRELTLMFPPHPPPRGQSPTMDSDLTSPLPSRAASCCL